jgi:hypothetical protein
MVPIAESGFSVTVRGETATGVWPLLVNYYSFGWSSACPFADAGGFTGTVFVAHQDGEAALQFSCRIE